MTGTLLDTDNGQSTLPAALNVDMKLIRAGAILVGVGGVLGFAGMILGGSALTVAVRQWVKELEQPPSELARQQWSRMVAASSAGAAAWKQKPSATNPTPT
jgi:hypothetical protein